MIETKSSGVLADLFVQKLDSEESPEKIAEYTGTTLRARLSEGIFARKINLSSLLNKKSLTKKRTARKIKRRS
jgi:hypothetical protein